MMIFEFLSMLKELKENGKIVFYGEAEKYQNHYFKESFAGAESVMECIGRYTHRIAISNSRILSMFKGLEKAQIIKLLYGKDIQVCPCNTQNSS